MIEINYTNNLDEIKRGFTKIHYRYTFKRAAVISAGFILAAVLGIDMVIKNPAGYPGYILTALSLGMGAAQWLRPYMVRSRMLRTIGNLNEDSYTARFYDDRIEVETNENDEKEEIVYISADGVDTVTNPEVLENPEVSEAVKKADKTIIRLGSAELCSEEDEFMFCLYLNRSLVYIFPKRCIGTETAEALREYFKDKAI